MSHLVRNRTAWEVAVPTHQVNLDALIVRDDFEARSEGAQSQRVSHTLKIRDLEETYRNILRKPDFQRETSSWKPDTVADLVKSFLDGELIPAVIMWHSPLNGTVFVIDGAHRLSALMAWVHDDYGDGKISREFWGYSIAEKQKSLAKSTKKLIESEIGSYEQLSYYLLNPDKCPDDNTLRRARNMATYKIDLQWVEGSAETAEKSFFKINGNPVAIDPTELGILKARRKPNAIATRALMNAGTGHKYWSDFDKEIGDEIETLSKQVYDSLFRPMLDSPVKTLDLPIAGQAYSANAFKMIFDFVNLVNDVTPAMWQEKTLTKRRRPSVEPLADDKDGEKTVEYLREVKKAADLLSGTYQGSLGLHPVVYFYGATGRFQPPAFLAAVKFISDLRARDRFIQFTSVRREFEEFIVAHRQFVSELSHRYGSRTRPLDALVLLYEIVLQEILSDNLDYDAIREKIFAEEKLDSLKKLTEKKQSKRKKFSTDDKSESFLREAIGSSPRCGICGARLHLRSITTDHKVRAQDGGLGDADNAQPSHPFCNSGFKESKHAKSAS